MRWGGSLLTSDPCAPSGRGLPRFHLLDLGLRTFKENLSVLRRLSPRVHTQNAALQAPRSLRGPPRICARGPRAELEDPEASARPRVRPLQQLGSHSCPLPSPALGLSPTPHRPTPPHTPGRRQTSAERPPLAGVRGFSGFPSLPPLDGHGARPLTSSRVAPVSWWRFMAWGSAAWGQGPRCPSTGGRRSAVPPGVKGDGVPQSLRQARC